mmetsp:Transcript_105886/g.330164  ORF Transcript_105886/g.330164 Transcript_105886/m.330164 type:complete len:429 (-) Transcript_105886:261-1547(-)
MSEFAKANKLVERFLGLSWGHLCPQFGFHHNSQHLLVLEVITSFLIFHFLLWAARCISSKFQPRDQGGANQQVFDRDETLQELERLSTMVDRTLTTMTQAESTAALASQQSAAASQSSALRTKLERPQDIERLREEFQGKIAAVKTKWQSEPAEEPPPLLLHSPDEVDEFHITAAIVVLYWALQAILSCVVMCSIGVTMIRIAGGAVWAHYCLLTYAVSNSGMLPTGCLALSFVADWLLFEGVTTLPVNELEPTEDSYQPIGQLTELESDAPRRPRRSAAEVRRHQNEVAAMKPKFVLLCLPELAPLLFMVVTHTIPFLLMFLWLTILLALIGYGVVVLVRTAVKRWTAKPRARILRQTQVMMFLLYMFVTIYIHTSVQVMTRVYAGEWRHGGFFDSLWWHLIIDTEKMAPCPWYNMVRLIDFPLRWT